MSSQKSRQKPAHYLLHRYTLQLVVVAVIVAGLLSWSWYAWQVGQNVNAIYDQANQVSKDTPNFIHLVSYTDTAKVFTLVYPSSWRVIYASSGSEGKTPDWAKVSRSFNLEPAHMITLAPNDTVGLLTATATDAWLAQSRADKFHTVQSVTINGYAGYFDRVVFTGPGNAERYIDDYYLIRHGSNTLVLSFRESYYHQYPAQDWNDVTDLQAFRNTVDSVRFLR